MPHIFDHEKIWEGVYSHIDIGGNIIDRHKSRVECIFPDEGDVVYIQKNRFEWEDGKFTTIEFPGILKGGQISWDTEWFRAYGWQASEHIFLLELNRKDDIGTTFYEIIAINNDKTSRARTWHWFIDEVCVKRTLCDEYKLINYQ